MSASLPMASAGLDKSGSENNVLRTRKLCPADQDKIWDWLHISLWDPPPAGLRPREVLDSDGVRIYAEDYGNPGDIGVVGMVGDTDIGACWMRVLPVGVGLASTDEHTPQIGIALYPEFQRKGYGKPLTLAALQAAREAGYKQLSLTVHPENPAVALYRRCGFEQQGMRGRCFLMVTQL